MQLLGTLQPAPPFDFALVLELVTRHTHTVMDHAHDGAYWRALRDGDAMALIRVSPGDNGALDVHLAASTGPVDAARLVRAAGRVLGVDNDERAFIAFAHDDPQLWAIVDGLAGIRMVRNPSVFEALMLTVTEQQISWVAAQKAQRYLVEWAGNAITHDGATYHAFPTPEQIAAATITDLTPLKITFGRMQRMIDIAAQVVDGTLDLEAIGALPPEDAYGALTALKGIGHWTATWTITRTIGPAHPYIGHNDVALQAAVNHYFNGATGRIPAVEVDAIFRRYGQFAGQVAHYTILRWVLEKYG